MNRLINVQNIKWACHHLHIDKSKSIDINLLTDSQVHMKQKWHLMKNIKKNYNEKDLKKKCYQLLQHYIIKVVII